MKYRVIENFSAEGLALNVEILLAGGWKLAGGVSVCAILDEADASSITGGSHTFRSHIKYSQALTHD